MHKLHKSLTKGYMYCKMCGKMFKIEKGRKLFPETACEIRRKEDGQKIKRRSLYSF